MALQNSYIRGTVTRRTQPVPELMNPCRKAISQAAPYARPEVVAQYRSFCVWRLYLAMQASRKDARNGTEAKIYPWLNS